MKMLKLLLLLFLIWPMALSAQDLIEQSLSDEKADEMIRAVFGSDMATNRPHIYQKFKILLQERLRIANEPLTIGDKFPKLLSAGLYENNPNLLPDNPLDPTTLNPLKYNLDFFPKTTKVYRLDNTAYIIIIEPENQ